MRALPDATYAGESLVRLELSDFLHVRAFIVRLCAELDDPDFFITSDLDSALPALLVPGAGLVYGALADGQLIATQAINFSAAGLGPPPSLSRFLPAPWMESTWTMVDTAYRRRGIARRMALRLETDAATETYGATYVATVHPRNSASLSLYFRLGYVGIGVRSHLDVPRMILVKSRRHEFAALAGGEVSHRSADTLAYERLFREGYICIGGASTAQGYVLSFTSPKVID